MKLGITRYDLPASVRIFCTLITGAGIGMFLAVAFVSEDDRKIFHFHYFVTAWLLVFGGGVLRSMTDLLRPKKTPKDLVDEKHVAS